MNPVGKLCLSFIILCLFLALIGCQPAPITSPTATEPGYLLPLGAASDTLKIDNTPPILSEPTIVDDGGQLKLKVTIEDPVNGGVRSGLEPSSILQSVTIVDRTVISANYIANDEYSGTFEAVLEVAGSGVSRGQIVSTQNLLTKNPGSRVYVEMSDRVRNQGIRDFSGGCGAGCTPHPKPPLSPPGLPGFIPPGPPATPGPPGPPNPPVPPRPSIPPRF